MEAALVSVATGALKPVLGKLAALMGDEYKRFKGVRKEIKFLTDELATMHAFLLEMSEEEDAGSQDKVWMMAVRELSYDMEDSIDDFVQCINEKDAKPDGFIEKIKHSLGKLGKMKTHRRIGREIHDLKKQIVEVGDRNARYKAPEAFSKTIKAPEAFSKTINKAVDPRALAIFEHASKLVGIDEPKAEIIELLLTEEPGCPSAQQLPKVVAIVGSGGMGKTTLANQVYQSLKEKFECQAFLSVSQNPDIVKILRSILSQVSNKDYAHTEDRDEQQLLSKISNFLLDKRYLIFVDDIWKKETWDVIKCAFPATSCGIIITTTRVNDVAHYSCRSSFSGHVYYIRPLDKVQSRQLFYRRLFNSEEDCPPYLVKVSDQILKKCVGLPLAIIAISGLLSNIERTEHLWNHVKDSIGCALERNDDVKGMMKILSLSYFDLPPHLKTCLLYLSVFPEDYIIKKQRLIRRWIAEGFIQKEGRHTTHELGERCFNELVNRSLIQPVRINLYGKIKSCRVHDIILDFIISKSVEENFVTSSSSSSSLDGVLNPSTERRSSVRRLSIQGGKQGSCILTTGMVFSHVRSVNVFGDSMEIPSLDGFRHLRVMDFGGCRQLENHHLANIGRLFQLRYLNLKRTGVDKLSEEIGHLRCLEMLDLRSTGVRKLPAAIANLGKLVHLFGNGFAHSFPDGIDKMQALETLQYVEVFKQSINFIQDLGQLRNMRKLQLYIHLSSVEEESMKALVSSLRELVTRNLISLTIWFAPCSLLMEPWYSAPDQDPSGLQELIIQNSPISHVPTWLGFLVNLQLLRLQVEAVGQKDLYILGGLPALLILTLQGTTRSKEKLIVSGGVGFPCLEVFRYILLDGGMELLFAAGSMPMPKLQQLAIKFHAEKTDALSSTTATSTSPSPGVFDFGIENLPCLVTITCHPFQNGYSSDYHPSVEAAKAAMERVASTHPKRPTLRFSDVW